MKSLSPNPNNLTIFDQIRNQSMTKDQREVEEAIEFLEENCVGLPLNEFRKEFGLPMISKEEILQKIKTSSKSVLRH